MKLPRKALAPVGVQMGAKIKTTTANPPPRLSKIILDINSHGVIDSKGLALCTLGKLHNSSAARAKKVCGDAEVGHGNVTSRVGLRGQEQFATNGPLLAFNGRYKGKPAIFAHVTSQGTLAITYVIIFVVKKTKGLYGTSLVANVPQIASGSGYISAFDLSLKRSFHVHGEKRSYVSASCPLSPGVFIGGSSSPARPTSSKTGRRSRASWNATARPAGSKDLRRPERRLCSPWGSPSRWRSSSRPAAAPADQNEWTADTDGGSAGGSSGSGGNVGPAR